MTSGTSLNQSGISRQKLLEWSPDKRREKFIRGILGCMKRKTKQSKDKPLLCHTIIACVMKIIHVQHKVIWSCETYLVRISPGKYDEIGELLTTGGCIIRLVRCSPQCSWWETHHNRIKTLGEKLTIMKGTKKFGINTLDFGLEFIQ